MPHLSLHSLKLRNYRCFEAIDIDFHPKLTVLVASNGAGKTSILDAIAVAFGPYIGAFDEAVGKHFEPSDIRQMRMRRTGTLEMEYAPNGVSLEATGYIPDPLAELLDVSDTAASTWRRTLSGPVKAKTTIKYAKQLIDYGKRMQVAVRTQGSEVLLPLVAYYGTGRLWQQKKLKVAKKIQRSSRTIGYKDSLDPASSYKSFVEWFRYWNLNATILQLKDQANEPDFRELRGYIESVKTAVDACLAPSGWEGLEYSFKLDTLVARHEVHGELPVEQLSDGIRNMIGMVADIAFRATKLNGQLGERAATETPGLVLIDEVDMHLHPEWQQLVLNNLTLAFPMLQFIVTTHSPQVISTVERDRIRMLSRDCDGVAHAREPDAEVIGLESAIALNNVMLVNPVPPVPAANLISDYTALIENQEHNTPAGQALRSKLLAIYGANHAVILDADRLIRFQAFKHRQSSKTEGDDNAQA